MNNNKSINIHVWKKGLTRLWLTHLTVKIAILKPKQLKLQPQSSHAQLSTHNTNANKWLHFKIYLL